LKKDIDEIFGENSEYILTLLLKLMDKYYGNSADGTSSDILDEIYEDKTNNNKSLSSQVVKPANDGKGNKSKSFYFFGDRF
jgi:hypothetical protein